MYNANQQRFVPLAAARGLSPSGTPSVARSKRSAGRVSEANKKPRLRHAKPGQCLLCLVTFETRLFVPSAPAPLGRAIQACGTPAVHSATSTSCTGGQKMSLESYQFSVRKLVIPVEKLVVPVEKLLVPVEKLNVSPRTAPSTGTATPWHGHPARGPERPSLPAQNPLVFRVFAIFIRSYMTREEKKGAPLKFRGCLVPLMWPRRNPLPLREGAGGGSFGAASSVRPRWVLTACRFSIGRQQPGGLGVSLVVTGAKEEG